MNSLRQFWILLRFQAISNPFILFMPLVFSTPLIVPLFTRSISSEYIPGLSMVISNPNLFFVAFFGIIWIAPESLGAANAKWTSGTGFYLTRAIDRHLLYRARSAFFYLIILGMPVAFLVGSFAKPNLQVTETGRLVKEHILTDIPGSQVLPNKTQSPVSKILIPSGNMLVNSYKVWIFTLSALGTLLFISLISRLRYKKFVVWGFYAGMILMPLLLIPYGRGKAEHLAFGEQAFFYFATHQIILWVGVIIAVVIAQLWCERRFSDCEF